jgi:Cu(I)/Ag(I) efflux system membrane protein CusA/SilA
MALQFPGISNAWTMPIKARTDMLATGIRTPVGVKVYGTDLNEMEQVARQIEAAVRTVPGTTSAFAERINGGYYLNIDPDRVQLARYGLMITDVQDVIASALGAEAVTTTVEGRERYTVSIRYPRELRSDPQAIATQVLIPLPSGQGRTGEGAIHHPDRERATRRLHLYRFARPRYRLLCSRRPEGGGSTGQIPTRLLRNVERPI